MFPMWCVTIIICNLAVVVLSFRYLDRLPWWAIPLPSQYRLHNLEGGLFTLLPRWPNITRRPSRLGISVPQGHRYTTLIRRGEYLGS